MGLFSIFFKLVSRARIWTQNTVRVSCEFGGQNIFSGLDARGENGHKDFSF